MSNRLRRAAAALLVAVVAGTFGVTLAPTASAQSPTGLSVVTRGYGHGRGLGQWGARGYADNYGWTTDQILNHYYGGTSRGDESPDRPIRVLLCDLEGVTICGSGLGVPSVVITSGAAFTIEGVLVPGGTALRITRDNARGQFKNELSSTGAGCSASGFQPIGTDGYSVDQTMDIDSTVSNPGDDKSKMLQVCSPKARHYRGVLKYFVDDVTRADNVNNSKAVLMNYLGIDGYLRGVVPSEMPSSWNAAALRAQAVAARSYALAGDNRFGPNFDTCDTIQCQVYLGASENANTNAAIAATAGQVRRHNSNNAIARTEFSSSTGGYTAGGAFPAVEDLGDGHADNPHNKGTAVTISAADIEAKLNTIGDFLRVENITRTGKGPDGGRVTRIDVVGSNARRQLTGDQFRSTFGLKSDWFTASPTSAPVTPTTAPGSPTTTAPSNPAAPKGVLYWVTRNSATAGSPSNEVAYGAAGYDTVMCDWDDNGTDTLGVYVGGTWYLRDDMRPGAPTRTFQYGAPGYQPICGDWDGDGRDSIGVYVGGLWYLRNDVGPGAPQISFSYGYAGTEAVVGNWEGGDRSVEVGIYEGGNWYLRNSVNAGPPSFEVRYGFVGPKPVIGDWDGNGIDGFGIYDQGNWYLRETVSPGPPNRAFAYGYAGARSVVGRWTVNQDGIGILETR